MEAERKQDGIEVLKTRMQYSAKQFLRCKGKIMTLSDKEKRRIC